MAKSRRGLASAQGKTRKKVASMGGRAKHSKRGLQAAEKRTRTSVAKKGGKASHGGGRKKKKR